MDYETWSDLMAERERVIYDRRAALVSFFSAEESEKPRILSEFVKPLNETLLDLNGRLGI